ncbi:MAG: hypothetical protein EPN97_00070 [Alphaproteobacteria bacterium]|nr:MAG: hypothetical protein EPN97_00070 [Alphaproteobacteria bacterium]
MGSSKTIDHIRKWVHEHDDRLSFILFYFGGAVLLGVFMNLFWVTALMMLHFAIEIPSNIMRRAEAPVRDALWHIKFDIGLILFSLVIAVYMSKILAVLGITQAVRATRAVEGVRVLTRAKVIEGAIRAFMMSIDDAVGLMSRIHRGRKGLKKPPKKPAAWRNPDAGDWCSLGFSFVQIILLLLAPLLTEHDVFDIGQIIAMEMTP